MKFFICVLIFLNSCIGRPAKNAFSGNWYTCGKDGTYYELLIKNNLFKFSTNKGLITKWYNFKITGDTLSYEDPYLYKDSVITKKSIIRFNNIDEMRLEYITSNEQWTFYRINEKISDIENDDKLKISTRERGQNADCPDKRTEEERRQDSLIKQINFQF
ncbi:MAG: hypothetical protein WCP69_13775 [Bacteroidota bacterium]